MFFLTTSTLTKIYLKSVFEFAFVNICSVKTTLHALVDLRFLQTTNWIGLFKISLGTLDATLAVDYF